VKVQPHNSLSDWVARWNKPLRRFLTRRLPKRIDAEDLAQEVYLRLLRVEDLDAIEEPQAYLYRMARNIAAEWRARASENHPHDNEQLDELLDLTTPETLAEEAIEERLLDEALRPLPAAIRGVIYLKLRDGKTHAEIAQHLGVTQRMVRKYLTAGYASLRDRLIKE
jgi:RNA polymerase sigma factor (sigma-70 family)